MNRGFPNFSLACLIAGLTMLTASYPACARQDQAPTDNGRHTSDSTELLLWDDPVVVTASKTQQRVSDSPAAVTVITEEEIQQSGATNLPDLLRSVPGVDVMEPNDSQANVSIRGFNQLYANKLLVMVDGRSIYDDFYGVVYWNTNPLLISRIKRIEIVRGPGSVLYGANAFEGVINIITKTPSEMAAAKAPGTFQGAVGEQDSLFSEMTYSGGKRDWAYTLGAGYHSTSGLGGQKAGQVKDSSRVPIFSLDVQKKLPRASFLISAANSDAKTDLSSLALIPNADWHTNSLSLNYVEDKTPNPISIKAFGNFLRINAVGFYTASHSYDVEAQQQRRLSSSQSLVYGGNYRTTSVISTLTGTQKHNQNLTGLYLQDEYHLNPLTDLFAGVRWDHHSTYGSEVSPRFSLVHHMKNRQTARLSYGTAFRAPTLLEEYLDQTVDLAPGLVEQINGSVDVKPEKVKSLEAGYRIDLPKGFIGLNVYDNHVTDVILTAPTQFAPSPPFPAGIPTSILYQNVGKAHASGFEVEGSFAVAKGIRGLANYAYENAKYESGIPVDFSPHHKINLVLRSDWHSPWTAYSALHYVGPSSYNNLGTVMPIRAYTSVDARIGYRIRSNDRPLEVSLVATNLFDDRHREMVDIPTSLENAPQSAPQRRTLWAMVSGKF